MSSEDGQTCRVFVGNLAWRVKWQDLKDHMKQVGSVIRADVFEDQNGRSRGCGIVEYETPGDAAKAMAELTDTDLMGRKIFVREDREDDGRRDNGGGGGFFRESREQRDSHRGFAHGSPSRGGNRYGGGGYSPERQSEDLTGRQIFVGNLSYRTSWQDLKDLFRQCGDVERADVFRDQEGKSKGCGTVLFGSRTNAEQAIRRFNEYDFEGRRMSVRIDERAGRF